jgi:hypothetical protein
MGAFAPRVNAQSSALSFLYPVNGQTVGGTNVDLFAYSPAPPAGVAVVFDYSLDGVNFTEMVSQDAPDFGEGSFSTSVDTTVLPTGTAYFRARYETDTSGPVISVQILRLPTPSCTVFRLSALSVRYDCSASQDQNGGITSYNFDFGDGSTPVTSATPTVMHSYPAFGVYRLIVNETDAAGLSNALYKQLSLVELALLQNVPTCGCQAMTVSGMRGNTTLTDPRRPDGMGGFNMAPLGPDPTFLSFNFQVNAMLTRNSNPALCTEGQNVRRTATDPTTGAQLNKMACTAGRQLPICARDADCDTITCMGSNAGVANCNGFAAQRACVNSGGTCVRTCMGGTQNGNPCQTVAQRVNCVNGGGVCRGNSDGRCTAFPFNGNMRGNDDYQMPSANMFPKIHANAGPLWVDFPGAAFLRRAMGVRDFLYNADFVSFVNGPAGNCSCHFTVTLDWNSANNTYRVPPTGIAIVNDAESVRCTVQ